MTTAVSPSPPMSERGRTGGLARATLLVSGLNLASRATGLLRVVAMSAALGATALGDTYQSANLVSNILFELLAGGLLSAALVPTFVGLVDRGQRHEAARLAGALLGAALAGLGIVVLLGVLVAPIVMDVLTVGVDDLAVRGAQRELGTFLLWFFLPQVLLYAVGAVATALLHAERRFVAAAVAPVFNNLVVIASMVAFWVARDGAEPTLDLTASERLILGAGATLGVLAMTIVPVAALRRTGLRMRPRWAPRDPRLRPLAAQGAWAAGHLGLNQVFAMATVIVAGRVSGGVVAYQVAFTFFLLPYALMANPVTTTLYPRLAAGAASGDTGAVAADLTWGLRIIGVVLLPAAVLIGVLARPILEVVRLGNLDAAGADLVALTTSGYVVGLVGYGALFLLTRAAYALGDTRRPTLVSLATTLLGIVGLVVGTAVVEGDARVLVLGLAHAGVVTIGAVVVLSLLRRDLGPIPLGRSLLRSLVLALGAGVVAWVLRDLVGVATRADAVLALVVAGGAGAAVYVLGQVLLRGAELRDLRRPGKVHP